MQYVRIGHNGVLMRSPFAGMPEVHRMGFERTGLHCALLQVFWRQVCRSEPPLWE